MALLMLLAAFAAIALVGLLIVGTLIKVVLWGVFLPLRLLLGVLLLPLLFVIKLVVGTILLAVVGPIVLVATLVAIIASLAAVVVPLLPLFLIGFVVYLLVQSSKPAVPETLR